MYMYICVTYPPYKLLLGLAHSYYIKFVCGIIVTVAALKTEGDLNYQDTFVRRKIFLWKSSKIIGGNL